MIRGYFTILFHTAGIQAAALLVLSFVDSAGGNSTATLTIGALGYAISIIWEICLLLRIRSAWYKKLLCVILMPTNYTPFLFVYLAIYLFMLFFQSALPANFG